MPEMQFQTFIKRPVEDVFNLIADLHNYPSWLSPSELFSELPKISDKPVKLGTTYIDKGQSAPLHGEITAFAPPHHIAFFQRTQFPVPPALAGLDITIEYRLSQKDGGTDVMRHLLLHCGGLLRLMQPRLVKQVRRENERLLATMKAYLEGEATHTDSA